MADSSQSLEGPENATITTVRSVREKTKVTVEDGAVKISGERAHATAHVALVYFIEWVVWHQTYLDAWARIRDLWQFTDDLQALWYAQPQLAQNADAGIKKSVQYAVLDEAQMITDERLVRNGVDLKNAWFVRPKNGDSEQRREGRLYFKKQPVPGTDFDPANYDGPWKWKPNLTGMYIAAMVTSLEMWLKCRSLFPWTSVDTESYEVGERAATQELTLALDDVAGATPTKPETARIATAMLATFDFFPPTLTATRTLQHGAAVAARHVVEHFQCIPAIKPAWRKAIADRFLLEWRTRTEANIARFTTGPAPKKAKTGSATSTAKTRDVTGLSDMINNWKQVETDFGTYYTAFSGALTW